MQVGYIIRLDDACPTMDKQKWDKMQDILDKYGIKPIVAIVPDNKDLELIIDKYDKDFWHKAQQWQGSGWHIALHGYDHVYTTKKSGLVPMNNNSEFAGISLEEQINKIKKGMQIFKEKGIKTNIWVAPSHTFDENTLRALRSETDIEMISDGIAYYPYTEKGFFWIPQQLWGFEEKKYGIWTICLHPNTMKNEDFKQMDIFLQKNKNYFINDMGRLVDNFAKRKRTIFEKMYFYYFFFRRSISKNKILYKLYVSFKNVFKN